ncbi:MAG: ABC transporter permease [Candidatus Bilamarchaeaceae archaeon]
MRFDDMLRYVFSSLMRRKLRSWLTLIGVIIGIATIITIISISDGVKADINNQLASFGTDKIMVVPVNVDKSTSFSFGSRPSFGKLYEKDADRVEKIGGVKELSKMVYDRTFLKFRDKGIQAYVYGSTANFFDQYGDYMKIEKGRALTDSERNVAVLGYDAANDMFGKNKISVGNVINIGGEDFRVVGILQKIGTSMSQSDDSAVYVNLDDARRLFKDKIAKTELTAIVVTVAPGFDQNEMKEQMEYEIAASHRVSLDDKDFGVITADFINQVVGSVLDLLTVFLLAITVIASIVAGIGISNTMFMSVLEKTQEIGTLKALGASRNDILLLFVFESALIGISGGVVGILIGAGLAFMIGSIGGIMIVITPQLVAFSLFFSVSVGAIAGFIPARRAAELDPVKAMREE